MVGSMVSTVYLSPIDRVFVIEVPIVNVSLGQTYNLPLSQELNGRNIIGVEAFDASPITGLVRAPSGKPLISLDQAVLTLVDTNSLQRAQQVPLTRLNPILTNGFNTAFKEFPINLQSSFIQLIDITNVTANSVALLYFYTKAF